MRMHIDSMAPPERALTPRQCTVVTLLSDGNSAKQVAHQLGISTRTVENHVRDAMRAARASNVTALVAKAIRQKWIS